MPVTNYEKVDVYPIEAEVQERLLREQNECTFMWGTRDHWAVGMIMSYVWRDGRFWLTATSQRKRIAALRRDNRVSISVSSVGTGLGPGKGISVKGRCHIRDDGETKAWFYPALSAAVIPGDATAQKAFQGMLDSPQRVIFEVQPEQYFTFDAIKMMKDSLFPDRASDRRMKELAGKVAVITGGGSGIGRGMALAFADAGMHVVLGDIELEAAERVRQEVEVKGVTAVALPLDVVSRAAMDRFAERIYAQFGAVHMLCNNAGVVTFDLMDGISDQDWRWVLSVNLEGVINGLQAFLPRMKAQPGEKHVVNTASIAGICPNEGIAPYVATKYAVVGISETLYAERKYHGIGCSVLCPGNVQTQIVASGRNRQDSVGGPDSRVQRDVQNLIAAGMDPLAVGRIVRQAVLDDDLYIFTHPDTRAIAEERFRAVLAAFDKCAARSGQVSHA